MGIKSLLYAILAASNDANAIKKGKVGRRIARRGAGKVSGKIFKGWFK